MRTLVILRGAPGAGKSTWIKEHHLEPYTLAPDDLRIYCSSLEMQPTGELKISQNRENESMTWEVLFKILEYRMSKGEFTIIDATASKTKDMQQYKDLASSYRYRMYCVDFTDVPMETCIARNKTRPEYRQVPQKSIENIYARFATQQVPSGITIIKPDEFDKVLETPIDLSSYKKLVFIGDIHGCYDTLMQYPDFKEGLKDDTEYIFLGDYIDRGNQNYEVLNFLNSIKDLPNVCLLEGNHERHIYDYGCGVPSKSNEFETKTRKELVAKGFNEKTAREFYRKCRQFSHIIYNGLEILACHGGIPNLNTNLLYFPTNSIIKGVGNYNDYLTVTESWMGQTDNSQYLIYGHRNTEASETRIADRVFNLEGKVEYGGQLRIVELEVKGQNVEYGWTEDGARIPVGINVLTGWNVVELEDCQPIDENLITEERKVETVEEAIAYLRNNKFINEKILSDGVSSFNFTREAFLKGNWNKQTVLARGLFIDTINNSVMARSYQKFFNINERPETDLANLKNKLVFPVKAYLKENGFLAIVSYNPNKDNLFIASKSTTGGDYVEYIKQQLKPYYEKTLKLLRTAYEDDDSYSLVFECIDIENDPHIIKYEQSKLVLLDGIKNELEYQTLDYSRLQNIATYIGCPVKQKLYELKTWEEFRSLYYESQEEDYQYQDEYIEGFVFVDSNGFMTKLKTGYYKLWKKLRGVAEITLRCGYITKTGMLTSSIENEFYGYCRSLYKNYYNKETKEYPFKIDIISLRDNFMREIEELNKHN